MSRRNVAQRVLDAIFDKPAVMRRGYDAASGRRLPREARMGRTSTETLMAASRIRERARYYVANDAHAAAAVNALVTYAAGTGPLPAHANTALAERFANEFWNTCDADNLTDFGGLVAMALRACVIDGEAFMLLLNRPDGLKLRLLPAEQIDDSKTQELGGGAFIANGVEFNAAGDRVAYWIFPALPISQFEGFYQSKRIDAADVLHLMRPIGIGQIRGVSALAPILLKLADLGLLSDALLKGFQVAAMHAGFLEDQNTVGGIPFEGEQSGDELNVSLEPGVIRRLPSGQTIKFNNPQAAQQSVEFMTANIEAISAGLGVPAFMVSGNVSRANYSSLRAALITFKASLETLQFNTLVPQLLAPIWRRWMLTNELQGEAADATAPEWRFPAMPEADPLKQVQANVALLTAKLASRKEIIAQRGESLERVDRDIAEDPNAQTQDDNQEGDSNDQSN